MQAMKADPSYDLDGDGVVDNRDMYISKIFDKDGDGKLNATERKNAEDAIRNGLDELLSKKKPKRAAFPEHPISRVQPMHRTQEELLEKRRESNKKKIERITKKIEE